MREDFRRLRKKFDGSDPFMTGGHQIIKSAGATRHAERVSNTPDWVKDDQKIREMLLRSFPRLQTDKLQRERAGRWVQVVQLYFRMGWTRQKTADEMGLPIETIKYLILSVKNAAEGKRRNRKGSGTREFSLRPPGRPKKIGLPIETVL